MDIFANNQKLPFEFHNEKTLGDLIGSLLILTNQANKIITHITIDGETLALDQKDQYKDRLLEDVQKLELSLEEKLDLVLFALSEARNLLPQFTANLSEVAELLMGGQKHKAMNIFGNALLTWKSVINYLKTVGISYRLDFSTIRFDDKTIEEKNIDLLKILHEIKAAMEREDIVTLGDLIEYELIPRIDEQTQVIDKLEDIVRAADKKAAADLKEKLQQATVAV